MQSHYSSLYARCLDKFTYYECLPSYRFRGVPLSYKGLSKWKMFGDQTSSDIVWWPNMLMLKCMSGQTVKTCLLKHRSNYGYKPLSKRGTHARAKHVWYRCPNEQNIAHQTREQKKCFKLFGRMLMAFKFYQTRSNSTKQGGQTVKCLVTFQCLMVCGCQIFPVWTDLSPLKVKQH